MLSVVWARSIRGIEWLGSSTTEVAAVGVSMVKVWLALSIQVSTGMVMSTWLPSARLARRVFTRLWYRGSAAYLAPRHGVAC